ncbi:unnamed protein product [Chondrus crispus]|uniref:Uncharacterized protein n=1 Tax=Chondrus crispus TaxID=2769 RepID=R7QSI7_CHOCR|nr:unnamed protein product [Chondrus crispus]CDF40350.1 unnamed protein product [Chondrus crispus]|eukprot:XP_005710644.1 unnamed protein product [Chondrus crispus]
MRCNANPIGDPVVDRRRPRRVSWRVCARGI